MATRTLECSVITPEGRVFEGHVDSVVIPAHDGEIGILPDRAPLLCRLGAGRLRVSGQSKEQSWFIAAGFAQVLENQVTVLTQQAIDPDQIDRAQAEAQLAEARKMKVTDPVSDRRKARAEASARAQLRMIH